jgi:hypothetical protein
MKCFIIKEYQYLRFKEINMNERYRVYCSLRKVWRDYEVRNDTVMVIRYKLIHNVWMEHNTIFVDGKLL